ncbi:MAG: hypothetical protein FWE06_07335 [Oscillospiraceae bacterium]|nr:hypothetical protein [Oscillospiraceae bacterium]
MLEGRWRKILLVGMTVVFLLSLMPIVWTGLHARPSKDDYIFSASSSFHHNWWWNDDIEGNRQHYFERSVRYAAQNGNVFDIGRAVGHTVADNYMEWQGTFTAIALFSLQPAVLFGHDAYPLTMLFTLFALIGATAFMLKTILGKEWLLPCLLMLTVSIQFVPHIAQGFFWYNGAVFYTFFYSLMLVSLALKIRLFRNGGGAAKIGSVALLSFLIGGGNLVTALLALQINVIFLLFLLWEYRGRLKECVSKWRPQAIFAAALALGFAINVVAPGNAVRGGDFGGLRAALTSIIMSIGIAARDILVWTNPAIVVMLLLALPLMWRLAQNTDFSFKAPLLVLAVSFLLFASQNVPPWYSMAYTGPPRLRNIVFFSYVWLLFGNAFYVLGWVAKNFELRPIAVRSVRAWHKPALLCAGLFLLSGAFFAFRHSTATWATYDDIRHGRVRQFLVEHNERQALLHSSDPSVTLAAFSSPPFSLVPWWDNQAPYLGVELSVLSIGPFNRAMADFYGKDELLSLPPPRVRAEPMSPTFEFQGRQAQIDTYLINANQYLRLRDLSYFLQNVFNVVIEEGQFSILTGYAYMPVGGEARLRPRDVIKPAYLHADTLIVDGVRADTVSYTVDGEVLFMIRELFELLDIEFDVRDVHEHIYLTLR